MTTSIQQSIFAELADFLATGPSPQEIIAYHLPDDLQQRAN